MVKTLEEVEQTVAVHGASHALMLEFFRLIPTSDSTAILPTFQHWISQLEVAGVPIDNEWYDRIVADFSQHGRLTIETMIQAEPAPQIELGVDDADVL